MKIVWRMRFRTMASPRVAHRPRSNGRGRRRIDVGEMRRRSLNREAKRLSERIQVVTVFVE